MKLKTWTNWLKGVQVIKYAVDISLSLASLLLNTPFRFLLLAERWFAGRRHCSSIIDLITWWVQRSRPKVLRAAESLCFALIESSSIDCVGCISRWPLLTGRFPFPSAWIRSIWWAALPFNWFVFRVSFWIPLDGSEWLTLDCGRPENFSLLTRIAEFFWAFYLRLHWFTLGSWLRTDDCSA